MEGIYDVHCHFLFGVDDGADTIEESMALIQKEYEEGVRGIVLTPHYRIGMFEPDREKVNSHFLALKKIAEERYGDLQVYLAREFHVNLDMIDMIEEDPEHFCIGRSKVILTEFSHRHNMDFIRERCYSLLSAGYTPLIAHVERYPDLRNHISNLEDLSAMGAYIQVNADSLSGKDGFKMKRFCKKLLNNDLVDFVGSDGHNLDDRMPDLMSSVKVVRKVLGDEGVNRIFCKNPKMLIDGEL